jgi:hypothetical protein
MADQNTQDQGTEATEAAVKLYATRSEAEANKPDTEAKVKVYEVLHKGTSQGFGWFRGYDHALASMARRDGYTVSTGTTKEVSKEAVAAKLATFSDDELQALGLTRKPAKGGKK